MPLNRDFIQGFITGRIQSGDDDATAKANLESWLDAQDDAIATKSEKQAIKSDLSSYVVDVQEVQQTAQAV